MKMIVARVCLSSDIFFSKVTGSKTRVFQGVSILLKV